MPATSTKTASAHVGDEQDVGVMNSTAVRSSLAALCALHDLGKADAAFRMPS